MGYQGMLVEMAKEYVVLATSQSQTLMCGGQMSLNKHAMEGWAPAEPQIVWNRSVVLSQLPQPSPAKSEHQKQQHQQYHQYQQQQQQQHYVTMSQHLAEKIPEPRLPQRNPGMHLELLKEEGPSRDEELRKTPMMGDKSSVKEAAVKSKKRFRLFRAMRSVIKSRFRK